MRRFLLTVTTAAILLLGSVAPAFAAHGATGCTTASSKVGATPAAAWVAAACARGN
jgi:hypothetical protein